MCKSFGEPIASGPGSNATLTLVRSEVTLFWLPILSFTANPIHACYLPVSSPGIGAISMQRSANITETLEGNSVNKPLEYIKH
jgi:hypothetical protein